MRRLIMLAALLAALLLLTACQSQEPEIAEDEQLPEDMVEEENQGNGNGGGEGDGGGEADATVELTAVDIDYEGVPEEPVSAGTVEFAMTNEGASEHDVTIEELGDEQVVELTPGGETGTGTVELEPGTYTVYCSVPGHREAGMEFTLEVE